MHSAGQAEEKPTATAKKRRRKQNVEIDELGDLLPFQGKTLDKLSILRLTTSYIKFQNFMTRGKFTNTKPVANQSLLNNWFVPCISMTVKVYLCLTIMLFFFVICDYL